MPRIHNTALTQDCTAPGPLVISEHASEGYITWEVCRRVCTKWCSGKAALVTIAEPPKPRSTYLVYSANVRLGSV